jgi:hypothetical protein
MEAARHRVELKPLSVPLKEKNATIPLFFQTGQMYFLSRPYYQYNIILLKLLTGADF